MASSDTLLISCYVVVNKNFLYQLTNDPAYRDDDVRGAPGPNDHAAEKKPKLQLRLKISGKLLFEAETKL